MTEVVLLTRVGCHLCDEARAAVEGVVDDLNRTEAAIALVERDVDADPALVERYTDDVPVVLVDGEPFARWHVDPAALRLALTR